MTDVAALLSSLRTRDVRLWIEGAQLKCSAPVGALDAGLKEALAIRKQEIIAFLGQAEARKGPASIVPIKADGSRPPIFAVSGHGGDVFCLLPLARHLHPEQPVIGVQPPGLDGSAEPLTSVEALARYEIEQIRRYRPHGPYMIAGHCAGGTLAFEVAQQLIAAGQEVALLALIGSPFPPTFGHKAPLWVRLSGKARALTPSGFKRRRRVRLEQQKTEALVRSAGQTSRQLVETATVAAVRDYSPQPYRGRIDLFVTADKWHQAQLWRAFAGTLCEHHFEDFEVDDLLLGPNVRLLAASLQGTLDQLQTTGGQISRKASTGIPNTAI